MTDPWNTTPAVWGEDLASQTAAFTAAILDLVALSRERHNIPADRQISFTVPFNLPMCEVFAQSAEKIEANNIILDWYKWETYWEQNLSDLPKSWPAT